MELSALPPTLAHERVQMCGAVKPTHNQQWLGPSGTFDKQQPKDRFKVAVSNMIQKRGSTVKALGSGGHAQK